MGHENPDRAINKTLLPKLTDAKNGVVISAISQEEEETVLYLMYICLQTKVPAKLT